MTRFKTAATMALSAVLAASAADVYVVASANAGAAAPYDTWETAITGILEAKAYAETLIAGGEPLVTLHLAVGTYKPRDQVVLTNAVHIVGHGADFDKVVIQIDNGGRNNAGADSKRGVILLNHADAWLENVKVTGGDVRNLGEGAGIRIQGAGGTVTNCHITGNSANGTRKSGGGVAMLCANALVTHCVINGNSSTGNGYTGYGGGVFASAGTLANCLVANNSARFGGGIALGGIRDSTTQTPSTARVLNCTIVANTASASGAGGVYFYRGTPEVVNSVFSGNASTAEGASTGKPEWNANATIPEGTFSHCAFDEAAMAIPTGDDCFSFAPSWADASYRLAPGSPLANSGTTYAGMAQGDLDGNPRLAGAAVDIGCYEDQNTAFSLDFVTSSAAVLEGSEVIFTARTGNEPAEEPVFTWTISTPGVSDIVLTGRIATNTFEHPGHYDVTLSADGAESATKADALHVGARTNYLASATSGATPTIPFNSWATAATNIHVVLAEAVDGATVLVGPGTYSTTQDIIISDGIRLVSTDGFGSTTIQNGRGDAGTSISRIVVQLAHPNALLEGFTITKGYARGERAGGGVFIDTLGGTVRNCRITGNKAVGTNCTGGGIACNSSGGLFERCLIDANEAPGNQTGYGGGAVLRKGKMRDCLVVSNQSWGVAGIFAGSSATIVNCTVVLNEQISSTSSTTTAPFGGIYAESGASVVNCIAAGNTAAKTSSTAGAPEAGGAAAAFSHCGVAAPATAPGTAGISAEDCRFADAANGDWRLLRTSSFYKKGQWQAWMEGAVDYAGLPRVTRAGRVDIGCFETPYVSPATRLSVR